MGAGDNSTGQRRGWGQGLRAPGVAETEGPGRHEPGRESAHTRQDIPTAHVFAAQQGLDTGELVEAKAASVYSKPQKSCVRKPGISQTKGDIGKCPGSRWGRQINTSDGE